MDHELRTEQALLNSPLIRMNPRTKQVTGQSQRVTFLYRIFPIMFLAFPSTLEPSASPDLLVSAEHKEKGTLILLILLFAAPTLSSDTCLSLSWLLP